MALPTRRSFLRAATTAGVAGVTGCAAFQRGSRAGEPRFGELKALNLDDEPHTFHVRVAVDDEPVYRESRQLAAAPPDGAVGAAFEGHPTEPAPYVVSAWRDDQSRADGERLDFSTFDADCLGVELQVGVAGADVDDPHLSIYHTTNCPPDG